MQTNYKYQPNFNLILDVPPKKQGVRQNWTLTDELKSRYFTLDYETKISDFDHWIFEPNFYWNHPNKNIQAVSYRVNTNSNNKIDTIKTIFYANEKIYLLETRSEYDAVGDANEILASFAIYNPSEYKKAVEAKVSLPYILLIIFTLIIILLTNKIPKNQIKNKYAIIMLRTLSVVMMTSTILITRQWHLLYTGYYVNIWETYIGFDVMSVIISSLLMLYMRSRCMQYFSFDYIIPHWIRLYMDNRKTTNSEKKLFTVFIGYPFYLTALPGGNVHIFVYYTYMLYFHSKL